MTTILLFLVLSVCLQETDCVLCFSSVDLSSGRCEDELGDVGIDECCQNRNYGYHDNDGACHYCGPRAISQWSSWSQCSELCGEGFRSRSRKCLGNVDPEKREPDPECHILKNFQSEPCDATTYCSVHGSWSDWTSWSECSSTCITGVADESIWAAVFPTRIRHHSCDNPTPSTDTVPLGNNCPGEEYEAKSCSHLPNCPGTKTTVDGGWGSWSSYTSCSVTCGVGVQRSFRDCKNPTPKHGGLPCQGAGNRTLTCETNTPCPVDGVWKDWSEWSICKKPSGQYINCTKTAGTQSRNRECLYRDHGGKDCEGHNLIDARPCYDVKGCIMTGSWTGWGEWSQCQPSCGNGPSKRSRERKFEPDYTGFRRTINANPAYFYGTPKPSSALPEGENVNQEEPCLKIPACPP